MESLADHSKGQPCEGCPRCRAVIQTAIALYKQGITEEQELMPTLMLARMFADAAEQSREIVEKHPSLQPVEGRGDVPVVRLEPLAVSAEKHTGTQVLKQVRVRVLSKHVKSENVRKRYSQVLLEEGARWDENNHGRISYECLFGYLEVVIAAGGDVSPHQVEGMGGDSYTLSYPAFHFPPPEVVAGVYEGLLGSDWGKSQYGFSSSLDVYGRSKNKERSPEKLILAFVAWHIGTQTGEDVPPRSRSAVARIINKNLLPHLGMRLLVEEQSNPDDTVWRDVRALYPRFVRLQQFIKYPSRRGSPLLTDL